MNLLLIVRIINFKIISNQVTANIVNEDMLAIKTDIVGLFDPEINDFTVSMWEKSDGEEIKNVLARINSLKLTDYPEDLLFRVLFTNACLLYTSDAADE